PSLARICRTTLEGWKRHRAHPDERVRRRFTHELQTLRTAYCGLLWAMERHLKNENPLVAGEIRELRKEIISECGPVAGTLSALLFGPIALAATRREAKRLARGVTYEPPTFLERRHWDAASPARTLPAQFRSATVVPALPMGAGEYAAYGDLAAGE
ncbi:MAG: B12-binding domain-containing radical SAM protein, partial [Bryobacterales bacterium]|nr:B12-binding domain-containing radical SAM protein [Bryobacterales bacterium]